VLQPYFGLYCRIVHGAWFYIPRREYAIPWFVGTLLSFVLALFALPAAKLADLSNVPRSAGSYAAATALVMALNAVWLWAHMRPQFLTWQTGRKLFAGTFITLTLVYLLIFAIVLVARGQAVPSLQHPDAVFTIQCALLVAIAMFGVLGVSAIWKLEEPGISNVMHQRSKALRLAASLLSQKATSDEYRELAKTATALAESTRNLNTQLARKLDSELCASWEEAATMIAVTLTGKALTNYNANPSLSKAIQVAYAALEGNIRHAR
jgi:hypothetical protein